MFCERLGSQSYSTYPNQRFLVILTPIAIPHPRSKYKAEPRENPRILRVLLLEISLRFLRSLRRNGIALACSTPLLRQTRYRKYYLVALFVVDAVGQHEDSPCPHSLNRCKPFVVDTISQHR